MIFYFRIGSLSVILVTEAIFIFAQYMAVEYPLYGSVPVIDSNERRLVQNGDRSNLRAGILACLIQEHWSNAPRAHKTKARTIEWCRASAELSNYLAFFALNFAHLARCAAAILSRAAAESLRVPCPRPPEFPATPINASIALSNFARSAFNCATTALRLAIGFHFPLRGRFDCSRLPSYGVMYLKIMIAVGRRKLTHRPLLASVYTFPH